MAGLVPARNLPDSKFLRLSAPPRGAEGGADPGGDDAPLGLAGIGKRVAHEVYAAALPGGPQNLDNGGLQPLMRVRDHPLCAAQAAPSQAAQELDPKGLGLAVADG